MLGGLCLDGGLLCVPVSRPLPGGDLPALAGKPNSTWRQIFLYLEAIFPILGDRPSWTWRQTTCVWRPILYLEADHLCNSPILAGQPPCIWRPTCLFLEANRPVLRNQGFDGGTPVWRQDPSGSCIVCVPACLFLFFHCYIRTTHAFVSLNSAH